MDENEIFAEVPEDLASIDDEALAGLIADYTEQTDAVLAEPARFVAESGMSAAELIEATRGALETLRELKALQAQRLLTPEDEAAFAALADFETSADAGDGGGDGADGGDGGDADAGDGAEDGAGDGDGDGDGDGADDQLTAAGAPVGGRRSLPRPSAGHSLLEAELQAPRAVGFVAGGGATNVAPGVEFGSELQLAQALIRRHETLVSLDRSAARGTPTEKYIVAVADWNDEYPAERRLGQADIEGNWSLIREVVKPSAIKRAMRDRIAQQDRSLGLTASGEELTMTASGGLCAPVTPYYNLAYISVPVRPVMGSLPSFSADRGGLRYARPASLGAVTDGIGLITEAEDAAGGTSAAKSCQTIPCPPFEETDVDIIYHCLEFGNLGARAFPELVAQWNNLVLAAHARLAESNLLTLIDAASSQVTAGSFGLGASATLFSQILAAANGLRNRNRMDPEAVLRLMIPWWAVDLIVSDVIRTQFQRFDTDQAKVTALLRSFNIEPTFYIDGANGRNQVFGTQGDGDLLPFPETVTWYLFPEGSFLYLDAGMLELGIVRDSVLNAQNNFQLFGETFESVAFVGVESLAVESWVCDSGTVSLPAEVTCPISYAGSE